MDKNIYKTPESVVRHLYKFISRPAEEERSWKDFEALFLPGARIRREFNDQAGIAIINDWSLNEFVEEAAGHYKKLGFWENEISRKLDIYGNIAHVFSTYESRINNPDDPPVSRGINSIQLLRRDGKWLITSIIFHTETANDPIPPQYLTTP